MLMKKLIGGFRPSPLFCTLLLSFLILSFAIPATAADVAQMQPDDVNAPNDVHAAELLVYDKNRVVTVADRGFPRDQPPRAAANGNWNVPINYAEGTLYFRVQIRSQPRPQNMRIQFCMWQYQFSLENCGSMANVSGQSGTVVTWSQPVGDMWKLGGKPMDWANPRMRYGTAIKNSAGDPVSNYRGWNWNGENPNHWYPLDMRHTVVVVEKGGTFSGWSNYVGGGGGGGGQPNPPPPPPTNTPRPANTPTPSNTPTPPPSNPPANPTSNPGGSNGDILRNGGFENGTSNWQFYSARGGEFTVGSPAYSGSNGAKLRITQSNSNTQLYQSGVTLKANTNYKLSFRGYSNSGHDLNVYLHKHTAPYTYYGLSSKVNLGTGWNNHEVNFTTDGFSGTASNARLRFWLSSYGTSGDIYYFDDVKIEEVGGASPTATPTPDPDEPPSGPPGGSTGGSNHVVNGSFEDNSSYWSFYTGGQGGLSIVDGGVDGKNAAQVSVNTTNKNIQLYQSGIPLKSNTSYRLSLNAYSDSGNDLNIYMHKHTAPYTFYGLSKKLQLGTSWNQYVIEFKTPAISGGSTSNARLRLWLANNAAAGDKYYFDDVVLKELSASNTQFTSQSYTVSLSESSVPLSGTELDTDDGLDDELGIVDIAGEEHSADEFDVVGEAGGVELFTDTVYLPLMTQ